MPRSIRLVLFALLLALAAQSAPQATPGIVVTYIDANGNTVVLTQGSTISFGATTVGTPSVVKVDIANQTLQPVEVNSLSISGSGFTLSGAPVSGAVIGAGADLRFTVEFSPTQTGAATGFLNVNVGTQALSFVLAAQVVVPTANIVVVTYIDANGNAVVLTQGATITFAPTPIGTPSFVTVDIADRDIVPAVVGSVAVSGTGFVLSGAPLPSTVIGAGADVRFTVQFNPTQSGAASGSLTVNAGTVSLTFNLSAQVVVPTSNIVATYIDVNGNAVVLAQGSTIAFAATPLGTSAAVTVDIANRGAQTAVVNSVAVSGPGFALTNVPLPGTILAAGSDLRFTVQFNPKQIGAVSGSLNVSAGTQNLSFPLSALAVSSTFTYQLQLGSNTSTLLPGQTITIPDTAIGASSSATVTIQNIGNAAGTISNITVTGAAFQLGTIPTLPITVAPGASQTISISFAPSQPGPATGQLAIGSDTFALASNGLGSALSFSYSVAGTDIPLSAGNGTISFVPVAVGATQSTTVKLLNTGTVQTLVANISVDGSGVFSVSGVPALPLKLNPGAGASFSVLFAPDNTGTATATLRVDANTFNLLGSATSAPVLSNVTFDSVSATQQPLAQPAVGLSLRSPYPLHLNGTLTLQFNSAVFSDDPSIQFSNGARTVAFTIPANTTRALFANNAQQVQLQTGSVAGAINLTASFATDSGLLVQPLSAPALTLTVAPAAPQIIGVEVSSSSSTGFGLSITGLATSRQVSQISVQFTPVSRLGLSIPNANLDVSGTFASWYLSLTSQPFGSLFTVTVPFTLQGQVSGYTNLIDALQSVTVAVSNAIGASTAQTISLH